MIYGFHAVRKLLDFPSQGCYRAHVFVGEDTTDCFPGHSESCIIERSIKWTLCAFGSDIDHTR